MKLSHMFLGGALMALVVVTVFTGTAGKNASAAVAVANITVAKAVDIAKNAYVGSGLLTDVELETEDGVLLYAIEFTETDGNEVDVKMNAKTGAVVVIESDATEGVDDDADDADDDTREDTDK